MSVTAQTALEGEVDRHPVVARYFKTFDAAIDFAKLVVPEDMRIRKLEGRYELMYMGTEGML